MPKSPPFSAFGPFERSFASCLKSEPLSNSALISFASASTSIKSLVFLEFFWFAILSLALSLSLAKFKFNFPNKESVLAALIDRRLPLIVEQILQDLPDARPADRLAEILRRSFGFVGQYPIEATLLFRVSRELPKPERDAAWSVFDPIRAELIRLCEQGIASGEFPAVDPRSLGTIVADHLVGGIDELSVRGVAAADAVIASRIAFLREGLNAP